VPKRPDHAETVESGVQGAATNQPERRPRTVRDWLSSPWSGGGFKWQVLQEDPLRLGQVILGVACASFGTRPAGAPESARC
jgi:hypothetical protein